MYLCVSVCEIACLCVCVCVCMCERQCVCVCVCVIVRVCVSVCLSVCVVFHDSMLKCCVDAILSMFCFFYRITPHDHLCEVLLYR